MRMSVFVSRMQYALHHVQCMCAPAAEAAGVAWLMQQERRASLGRCCC